MPKPCPHRPECPGCDWLERPYEEQLQGKADLVRTALGRWPDVARSTAVAACLGAAQRAGYRTRVKWAVDGRRVGLYGSGHDVVDTPFCRVAPDAALAVAAVLRRRTEETGPARLAAIDIRHTSAGETAVTLVVEAPDAGTAEPHARALASAELSALPLSGVAWSWRRPESPTTLGGWPSPLAGQPALRDRVGLAETLFPPGAFSQAHREQTARLQGLLREAVKELPGHGSAHLVDLHAGTGGMGLALRDLVARLTLVEPHAPAAAAAGESAPPGTEVLVMRDDQALARPERFGARPLVVLLDPPRTGLTGRALAGLARLTPDRVLYVSCDPGTLARDLAFLSVHGLRAETVVPMDMMPGTSRVEAAAVLAPGEPAAARVVLSQAGLLVLEKPPLLPVVPRPEWRRSLLDQARELLPAARPAHRLDEGTSGLCVFVDGPGEPLRGARKKYLALVRGRTRSSGTLHRLIPQRGRLVPAETRYVRLDGAGGHSLLEVELLTGRTHQIRRHLAWAGHPVLGDERYGDPASNRHIFASHGLVRPFLHAAELEMPAAGAGAKSPLPPDLLAVLESLRRTGASPPRPASPGRGRR